MSDVLVYAHRLHADTAQAVLGAACAATGLSARLDVYGSGSLYQRLGPRRGQPLPDLVWWFGPFAASAAAADSLLQAHQPRGLAQGAAHDADWKWTTIAYSGFGVIGGSVSRWEDLAGVPRLAIADPERSEVGLSLVLASLDRARRVDADAERGWAWWQERARNGLVLAEDDASARALTQSGQATHAVVLDASAAPVADLASLPHAIGLAAMSKNVDAARTMLDWLTSDAAADKVPGSVWRVDSGSLPQLDIEWARQQYVSARQRWASSAFGPSI